MNAGRPLQFDPDVALDSAMEAFWSKGYEACSLQELLKQTGLSKSSLYHTFGGKRQLFQRCLERYREQSSRRLAEHLKVGRSPRDFIADTLNAVAAEARPGANPRGCFVMNTASEFAQSDPEVASLVAGSLASFREIFREAVRQGQREGEITCARSAENLAIYLVSSMGGLRTIVKGGLEPAMARSTVEIILRALD
jgi:TetR/AcrR family transcriptional repressor of nem operon